MWIPAKRKVGNHTIRMLSVTKDKILRSFIVEGRQMLDSVVIKKDGFYGNFSSTKRRKRKEWQKKIKGTRLLYALRHSVEIEEGVTFGDIIRAVNESKPLTAFIGLYNHCDAKAHNEFILNTPPDPDTELEWIEVGWYARVWGEKLDNDFEMWTDCCGVGKEGSTEDGKDRQRFAIDLTPANKLTNLPVKIKKDFDLWIFGAEGTGVVVDEKNARLKANSFISLLEFLDSLYEEISFFGSPDVDRQGFLDKLCEAKDEIVRQMEEGKALPYDETANGMKIYLSDQVRNTLGLPSNEEDRDDQIRQSAEE